MEFVKDKRYWFAVHATSGSSGSSWPKWMVGAPFEVELALDPFYFSQKMKPDKKTPVTDEQGQPVFEKKPCKALHWRVVKTGELFSQSTWPRHQLGKFRPPFAKREEAQEFCDGQLVKFDEDGNSLNKISKSQQEN